MMPDPKEVNNKRYKPVSVWITRLSLAAILPLLGIFFRHGPFLLWFTSATRSSLLLAKLFWSFGLLKSPFRQVEFTRHGERVDASESAIYHIQAKINWFTDQFFMTHGRLLEEIINADHDIRPAHVFINLKKVVAQITYDLLIFVELARYWHEREGGQPRCLIILSPWAVLANSVASGWIGENVEFICQWSWYNSLTLQLSRAILRFFVDAVQPRRRPTRPASVAVEAAWGLDRLARYDDLFWWWDSGIKPERILLCFDRSSDPATREAVEQAQRLGIQCVVLNRLAIGDSPQLYWRAAPGIVVSINRLRRKLSMWAWGFSRGPVGRFAAYWLLTLLLRAERIEDFLREFNVKCLLHYQDTDLDYLSVGCDAAGAARIGYQWSNLHWVVMNHARLHQVYFIWGPLHYRMLEAAGSCVDHVLVSGCIVRGSYQANTFSDNSRRHRAAVTASGADRVLTLFDTSSPCERFYDFFLSRVIEDTRWGLIIKPKSVEGLPWVQGRMPQLKALYEKALATGRVIMLDDEVSPAEAAAAADFTVGVDINSATIIAALAGYRAIHLNYTRLHASPLSEWAHFYRAGPDRLVFDDPWKLWGRLNNYFDDSRRDPALGVVDDTFLSAIDPFRDGRAGERIGAYIRWYLEGIDYGLNRDRALQEASQHYAKKWGTEMVGRIHQTSHQG